MSNHKHDFQILLHLLFDFTKKGFTKKSYFAKLDKEFAGRVASHLISFTWADTKNSLIPFLYRALLHQKHEKMT